MCELKDILLRFLEHGDCLILAADYMTVSPGPVSAFLKVLMTQCDDVSPGPGYRETCHRGVSNGPVMILVKDTFRRLVARLAGCPRLKHSDSRFPPVLSLVR